LKILFVRFFAAHRQLFAATRAAGSQHTTTVCSSHTLPETVFVFSFALRWLKGPFHDYIILKLIILLKMDCKYRGIFYSGKLKFKK
jgi:hypothetical protein